MSAGKVRNIRACEGSDRKIIREKGIKHAKQKVVPKLHILFTFNYKVGTFHYYVCWKCN